MPVTQPDLFQIARLAKTTLEGAQKLYKAGSVIYKAGKWVYNNAPKITTKRTSNQLRGSNKRQKTSTTTYIANPSGTVTPITMVKRAPKSRTARKSGGRKTKKVFRKKPRYKKKSKRAPFSTKGFRIIDRNNFTLDVGTTPKTLTDFFTGAQYLSAHIADSWGKNPTVKDWTIVGTSNILYGRYTTRLSQFIGVTSFPSYFRQYKVNWISHTYRFPDEEAPTTNDAFPLKMYVNYKDMYHTSFDGGTAELGYVTVPTVVDQFLERPGWKQYNPKRNHYITVKYKPTILKITENRIDDDNNQDTPKMRKHGWRTLVDGGETVQLRGPTIAWRMQRASDANPASVAAAFDANPFLRYTVVEVKASISFRGVTAKTYQ